MGIRKSIMGFDQAKVASLEIKKVRRVRGVDKEVVQRIDVTDLLLIQQIADFPNRKNIVKVFVNGNIYFWVSYKEILSELPILDIKKQALTDRLNKLCDFGILEKTISENGNMGNMTFFRMGDMYEGLKYECSNTEVRSQLQEGCVVNYDRVCSQLQDKDIYNNITKDNNIVSTPSKEFDAAPNERLTLFCNSEVGRSVTENENGERDYSKFLAMYRNRAGYERLDMVHYYNAVDDWSNSSNTKRTNRGWKSTINQFIRGDKKRNELHLLPEYTQTSELDLNEAAQYLNL